MSGPTITAPRPGGISIGGGKKAGIKQRGVQILAWVSFAFGIAAGNLLAPTFIGGIVDNLLSVTNSWGDYGSWIPVAALGALVVAVAIDLFMDGVPNRWALYSVMALPSVARSVDGKLGDNVEKWSGVVRGWLDGMDDWLGTSSAIGLAVAAGLCAWIVARRTMAARPPKAMG